MATPAAITEIRVPHVAKDSWTSLPVGIRQTGGEGGGRVTPDLSSRTIIIMDNVEDNDDNDARSCADAGESSAPAITSDAVCWLS